MAVSFHLRTITSLYIVDFEINAILLIVGLAMLCFGGNWLVSGGVTIAKKLRVGHMVIGMTIIAFGTSTPELAASIAAISGHGEIVVGNIVGSNIANVGLILGVAAIMVPLTVNQATIKKEIPVMIGVGVLLISLSLDGVISFFDGIFLLASLVIFAIFTYKTAKKNREQDNGYEEEKSSNVYLKSIGLIALGIILLGIGARLTIDNAVSLAVELGLSETLLGLTIIAIGTSLPEFVTSILAIRKGNAEIGVGNIIGSNIYNILIIMGISATLGSIVIKSDIFIDYVIMIAFSASLLVVLKTGVINRLMGFVLSLGYAIFLMMSFLM